MQLLHTIIERAGRVEGRVDERLASWNKWHQGWIIGGRTEVLRVNGQRVGEQESRELSTPTARIHSDRSSDERALHSRRTSGLLHVLLLLTTVADSRREGRRTRTTARKDGIGEQRRRGVARKERVAAHLLYFPWREEILVSVNVFITE
jgi:sirohydrochlorin ferrochelatase